MEKETMLTAEDMALLTDPSFSSEDRWEILLGSSDENLCKAIERLYCDDDRVDVTVVKSGCDTLVVCSQNFPHLIIVDEDIPDIPCSEVIKCIKRRDEFRDILVLCAVKSEYENDSVNQDADDFFLKADIDDTYLSRKINTHLFASDHVTPQKRRWSRKDVNFYAKLELSGVSNPNSIISGEARVKNISRTGAFLADIKFESDPDEEETYNVILKINHPPLTEWEAESVLMHLYENNTAGLKFINISKKNHLKLSAFIGK